MPYKVCEQCQEQNGVRTLICKSCKAPFKIKSSNYNPKKARRRRKKQFIKDWRSLSKGDVVRVIGGSGPFYDGKDGMRHYLTDRGKYTIDSIDKNGLHVLGIAPRTSGQQFLYMGPLKKSPMCSTVYRDKHKLLPVAVKQEEI